eukprot:scaffold3352_cov326-Prasinococcus_capsulatus_cf.AAC.9
MNPTIGAARTLDDIDTPGVIWMRPSLPGPPSQELGDTEMKPMTKSLCSSAIFAAAFVYSPLAIVPLELISASRRRPRPFSRPGPLSPSMIPDPGTMCALVMWDQSAIL